MNIILIIGYLLGIIGCLVAVWFILYLKKKTVQLDNSTTIKLFVYKDHFTKEAEAALHYIAQTQKKAEQSQKQKSKKYIFEQRTQKFPAV